MPVTFVQEADAASATVNLGSNASAGNTVVVAVACLGATSATGVTGVTIGGSADNFALVTPGPSAQDTTSPNDFINVSVWADPNCQSSAAISVTGTGVVATWAWEFSGMSGVPENWQVFAVPTYQDSWVTALPQTTAPAQAWLSVTAAANQTSAETLTVNNVTGWTLQNAYNGTSGSYFWGADAGYQTVNTVGAPAWSGSFSQPSFSVTVLVTLPAAPVAAPAVAAVAGTPLAAGVSAVGGSLQVASTVSASTVQAGAPVSQTVTSVNLVPTNVKTGNYTAKPGDFVIAQAASNSTVTITFPSGAPTGALVGVKLIKTGVAVTAQAAGSDVFDALPAGTNQILLKNAGATFIAQYRAANATWYIQSASYTEQNPVALGVTTSGYLPGTPDANSPLAGDVTFATWSYDQACLNSPFAGTALTSGKIYLVMCPVRSTVATIGVIEAWITSAGSGLTAGQNFVGAYDGLGNRLATTDATAAFGAAGELSVVTGTNFTITPPFIWVALLSNGTTPPSFARTGSQTAAWANGNLATNQPRFGTLSGTFTSLPSTFGVATPTTAAAMYWVGLF